MIQQEVMARMATFEICTFLNVITFVCFSIKFIILMESERWQDSEMGQKMVALGLDLASI
jgi:hypothetical protein